MIESSLLATCLELCPHIPAAMLGKCVICAQREITGPSPYFFVRVCPLRRLPSVPACSIAHSFFSPFSPFSNWGLPLMMSTNILDFLTPSPLSAFGSDLYYEIHATSLICLLFHDPLSPLMRTSYLEAPLWIIILLMQGRDGFDNNAP